MADCKTCKEQRQTVPYIVHEADMARQERTIKRLWILLIIVIFLFVCSNCAWLWYNSQFEDVESTEVTQGVDTGEGDAIVTGIGDINCGESPANG